LSKFKQKLNQDAEAFAGSTAMTGQQNQTGDKQLPKQYSP